MAYPVEVTLGTGNKVSLNYQSEEVSVSITYRLERGEEDVLEVVKEKAPELVEAHRLAWERVREAKTPPMPPAPASVAKIPPDIPLQEPPDRETASALPSNEVNSDDEQRAGDEDTFQGEDLPETDQTEEMQMPITAAQVQVILALGRALELDEKALEQRLSDHAGETVLECLTHAQAATLIVGWSRERREQLDRERNGSRA